MSIVTLAAAKLHLRVDEAEEDTLIQALINAAEFSASQWLGRNLYADQNALNTAISGVAAALSAATDAYVAAIDVAEAIDAEAEYDIAVSAADAAYLAAQTTAKMTYAGVIMNDAIRAAVLLTVGHLYANREATAQNLAEMPMGVQYLLQPLKVYG